MGSFLFWGQNGRDQVALEVRANNYMVYSNIDILWNVNSLVSFIDLSQDYRNICS